MNSREQSVPLRHRMRTPINIIGKFGAAWQMGTDPLWDCTGGLLTQSLAYLPPPSLELLDCVAPSYGFDMPEQHRAEAALLNLFAPNFGAVLWSSAGSLSNELALWAAIRWIEAQGQSLKGVIVDEGGYHGNTELTRLVSRRVGSEPLSLWHQACSIPMRPVARVGEDFAMLHARWIEEQVSGDGRGWIVLIEPRSTTGSNFAMGLEYLRPLTETLRSLGCVVIFDEIASGMYRHGVSSYAPQCAPHAVTVSKGLTQGRWPLAATIFGPELEAVIRDRGGLHMRGFTAGLSAAAAHYVNVTLDIFEGLFTEEWLSARACDMDMVEKQVGTKLRLERTPTTLRLEGNPDAIATIVARLRDQRMWAYAASRSAGSAASQFLHYCPMFDLKREEQIQQFQILAEVLAEKGA